MQNTSTMRTLLLLLFCSLNSISQDKLTPEQLTDLKKSILIDAIKYGNKSDADCKAYYLNDKSTLILDIQKVQDTFHIPNSKWTYFEVINDFEFQNASAHPIIVYIHGKPVYDNLNRRNLIALDEKNNLIYLGGGFQKSSVSHLFNLNEDEEDSFYNYLKIKFYNYNIKKIKRVKKNKKYQIFKAYSWTLMKEIKISVNRKNFEDVEVM